MKRIFSVLIILLFLCPLLNCNASAHEMYWYVAGTSPNRHMASVIFRWNNYSGSKLNIKVFYSGYVTNPTLINAITNNYGMWNGAKVTSSMADSITNSNVVFMVPTTTYFNSILGAAGSSAATVHYDTNGQFVNTATHALTSTKLSRSAQIYFNPDETPNSTAASKIVVHELGHVLCLGHPITYYVDPLDDAPTPTIYQAVLTDITSVMHQGYPTPNTHISSTPTSHDTGDLSSMY